MPRLSKHEKSGTIGMLKVGLRVTDIAQYYNCHPSTMQVLRVRFKATGTVKKSTPVWSTKNYNTSSRRYIDSLLRPVALSYLHQNQRTANFIDQHDKAPVHTASLTVNFQAANIILVLDRPPLSQEMSAIKLLIATLKCKGIAI